MRNFHRLLRYLALALCFFLSPLRSAHASPDFTRELGLRMSSATAQSITGTPTAARLYFLREFQVFSATTSDGLTWTEESGVRLSSSTTPLLNVSSVTGFSALPLSGGGLGALFSVVDSTGAYWIYRATSSDGLAWANTSTVTSPTALIAPISTSTFIGCPRLLLMSNGDWRAYYVENISSGTNPTNQRVFTSLSTDEGVTWSTGTQVFSAQVGEVAVSTLTSARVRLYYTSPLTSETTNTQLLSAISSDANGTSFTSESGTRFSTATASGAISFPLVTRSTESFRWRLYYGFNLGTSTSTELRSALTIAPDLQSVTPTSVDRADAPHTFTIRGEVFSPSPTVTLSKSGQTDITGTSVSRSDDQNMTAVLDTTNKDLGPWSLTVANSDGQSDTLTNAVTITFSGGSLVLIDNLLRPLAGARTRIDVTVFADGNVKALLYTLDGRLVRRVIDQSVPIGTSTFYWDGTTDDGHLVASGAYILKVKGPKLDTTQKIVVIK